MVGGIKLIELIMQLNLTKAIIIKPCRLGFSSVGRTPEARTGSDFAQSLQQDYQNELFAFTVNIHIRDCRSNMDLTICYDSAVI